MIQFQANDSKNLITITKVEDPLFFILDFVLCFEHEIQSAEIDVLPYKIHSKPPHFFDLVRALGIYNLEAW